MLISRGNTLTAPWELKKCSILSINLGYFMSSHNFKQFTSIVPSPTAKPVHPNHPANCTNQLCPAAWAPTEELFLCSGADGNQRCLTSPKHPAQQEDTIWLCWVMELSVFIILQRSFIFNSSERRAGRKSCAAGLCFQLFIIVISCVCMGSC